MNIGLSMAFVGFLGALLLTNFKAALGVLESTAFHTVSSYDLVVIPLFILMGHWANRAGLIDELYDTAYKFMGHWRGGMAISAVASCAGFSAVSGSSPATVATIGTVAMPSMRKYNYDDSLSSGAIVAGGTLGILIPPSVILILYGALTEQSIGKLFLAGIIPGIMLTLLFMITVNIWTRINPNAAPSTSRVPWSERIRTLKNIWGILVLFIVVMGGIFLGVFTPTEASAAGAFGALLFLIFRRKLQLHTFLTDLLDTTKTTSMIFLILVGGHIFGYFLAISTIPAELAGWISGLDVNRYLILAFILLVYIVLGCIMDALAMLILTLPIFFPLIKSLGFDPIWFGIIQVLLQEQALITPPIGMNVFVLKGVFPEIELQTIFKGIWPFWFAIIVCLLLIILFPQTTTWLPNMLNR